VGAGLTHLPASVELGQLVVRGALRGPAGAVEVTSGDATVGLLTGAAASGSGQVLDVTGTALLSFPSSAPAARLELSGVGSVTTLVAGRAA